MSLRSRELAFSSGARFGPFEILEPLGAGGMGEVYRATDTRLGRDVALKRLPPAFASDPDRRGRFEREARLLASLNHPGIAQLYGLETVTGDDGETVPLLVMELAPGEDLAARLKRGRIPVEDVLSIARQIAEALEEAHERGIVHRDLKPANVRITPEGGVKILDFGLAKAWRDEPTAASVDGDTLSQSPTLAHSGTQAGVILGTAAYMSPDQARGRPVDRRADIWAYGVLVFEMLTGRPLFEGTTTTDLLAAVVRQEIDWSTLPADTPPVLRRLLRRCLDRDPKTRLRDVGEARVALTAAAEEDMAPPSTGAPGVSRRSFALGAALTGVGALVGFGLGRRVSGPAAVAPGASLRVTRVTGSGHVIAAAISPDARYVAYVESDQGLQSLWLRQLASGQTLRLIPERPVAYWGLTITPDGNSIVFGLRTGDDPAGGLFAISTLGGAERRLVSGMDSPPTFSPDGERMAYLSAEGEESHLMVAGADGRDPKALATFTMPEAVAGTGVIFYAGATWAPDGSHIVTAVVRAGSADAEVRARLVSISVADGSVSELSDPGWVEAAQAGYLPDGRGLLVIARASHQPSLQIWHVAVPGGEASPVTNDLGDYRIVSLSRDGASLVTVQGDLSAAIWVGPRDASAPPRRQSWGKLDGIDGLGFTGDGRLVYTTDEGSFSSVWTTTTDGSERAPVWTSPADEPIRGMAVSGAGDLFLTVRTSEGYQVRVVSSDGTPRGVAARNVADGRIGVSRDGALVYTSLEGGSPKLFRIAAPGAAPEQLTTRLTLGPCIDPQGQRIAFYFMDDAGRFRIGILPSAGGELIWSTSTEPPPRNAQLLLRGDDLYTNTMRADRANVWRIPLDGSAPERVTAFEDESLFRFDLSEDGRTLAVVRGPRVRDALLLTGFPGSPPTPS